MSPPRDRLAQSLVRSALEFHKLRLWTELRGDRGFIVRLPDEPEPLFVFVFGQLGQHFGLSIHRGKNSLEVARDILLHDEGEASADDADESRGDGADDRAAAGFELPEGASVLSISFERLSDVPPEWRQILNDAGVAARRESIVPNFIAMRAPRRGGHLNRTEMRLVLTVLDAIRAARELGPLATGSLMMDERLPVIRLMGEVRGAPLVECATEDVAAPWSRTLPLSLDPRVVAKIRKRKKREVWFAGFITVPRPAGASGPDPIRAFGICDDTGDMPILLEFMEEDSILQLVKCVTEAIAPPDAFAESSLPRAIHFLQRGVHCWLEPLLTQLGVKSSHIESSEAFDQFTADSSERIVISVSADSPGDVGVDQNPVTIAEWKAIDHALCERLAVYVGLDAPDYEEALARFFGDVDFGHRTMTTVHPDCQAGFLEWYAADWRAEPTEPTLVERWAERADAAPVVALLEARRRARVSIYSVTRVGKDLEFEVVDTFTGKAHTAVAGNFTDGVKLGAVLPLRLIDTPAGTLALLAGPPLDAKQLPLALASLAAQGGPVTSQSLQREPERIGLLYRWLAAASKSRPRRRPKSTPR